MNLGFDAKRLFLNSSGLGNYSRNLIHALYTYHPSHKYYLFTPKTGDAGKAFLNHHIVMPKAFHHKLLKSAWRSSGITGQINALQLDVYHGLSNELPFTISRFKGKKIVTIHDLIFLRFPEYYKAFDRNIYNKKVKHACAIADTVISISQQTKNDLVELLGVDEKKIVVHGQSCNRIFWDTKDQAPAYDVCEKHQLPQQFILYVGTVEPRKNLLELLKAMKEIDMPLVVVGKLKDKYGQQVMNFIHNNGLMQKIFFPKAINNNDLALLYKKAFCLVYPSVFEGFGLPVLEAMVCGCPVITGNQSSMPEVGGDAALYINVYETGDYMDKIRQMADEGFRAKMVTKGYQQAVNFSYENWAKKTFEVYATSGNF